MNSLPPRLRGLKKWSSWRHGPSLPTASFETPRCAPSSGEDLRMPSSDRAPAGQFFRERWNKNLASKVSLARRRRRKSQPSKTAGADSQASALRVSEPREITMNASFRRSMALTLILAIPFFARPALGAPGHDAGHKPAHHRAANFTAATAFASPAAPVWRAPETDGLSRDAAECSRGGCIDN
jgi:hypothetical protein